MRSSGRFTDKKKAKEVDYFMNQLTRTQLGRFYCRQAGKEKNAYLSEAKAERAVQCMKDLAAIGHRGFSNMNFSRIIYLCSVCTEEREFEIWHTTSQDPNKFKNELSIEP